LTISPRLTLQVQAYALHASMVGLHTLAFFKSVRRLGARSIGQRGRLGGAVAGHHGLHSLHLKAQGCSSHSWGEALRVRSHREVVAFRIEAAHVDDFAAFDHPGAVPTAISKGTQQAGNFLFAHLFFCGVDPHECIWNNRHGDDEAGSWRAVWSSWQKPVAFLFCCAGVVVYMLGRPAGAAGKGPRDEKALV